MKPKPFSPLNHFTVPKAMSAPSQAGKRPHHADSRAAALITRVGKTRHAKSAWNGLRYPPGAENVYGNQNCNINTVAQNQPPQFLARAGEGGSLAQPPASGALVSARRGRWVSRGCARWRRDAP